MNSFAQLLNNSKCDSPSALQRQARSEFPARVESSGFGRRTPDDPIPDRDKYMVIGVATWSIPELELLDELADSMNAVADLRVDVFDVAECEKSEDFDRYIPTVSPAYQTPVIRVWRDGAIIDQQSGLLACRESLRKHGLL